MAAFLASRLDRNGLKKDIISKKDGNISSRKLSVPEIPTLKTKSSISRFLPSLKTTLLPSSKAVSSIEPVAVTPIQEDSTHNELRDSIGPTLQVPTAVRSRPSHAKRDSEHSVASEADLETPEYARQRRSASVSSHPSYQSMYSESSFAVSAKDDGSSVSSLSGGKSDGSKSDSSKPLKLKSSKFASYPVISPRTSSHPDSPTSATSSSDADASEVSTAATTPLASPTHSPVFDYLRRVDDGPQRKRGQFERGVTDEALRVMGYTDDEIKRQEIISELIATEEDYVNDLNFIKRSVIKPTKAIRNIPLSVATLFSDLEDILTLHTQILNELQKAQVKDGYVVTQLASVLLPFVSKFDIYGQYLCTFESASRHMSKAMQKDGDSFGKILNQAGKEPEARGLAASAYIMKPFQRLLKYPLFCKNLVEVSTGNSAEYTDTIDLCYGFEDMIKNLQDEKRREEHLRMLQGLEKRIRGLPSRFKLAREGRTLIRQGPMFILDSSVATSSADAFGGGGLTPLYAFLFDDMILWCKRSITSGTSMIEAPAGKVRRKTLDQAAPLPLNISGKTSPLVKDGPEVTYKVVMPPSKVTCVAEAGNQPMSAKGSSKRYGNLGVAFAPPRTLQITCTHDHVETWYAQTPDNHNADEVYQEWKMDLLNCVRSHVDKSIKYDDWWAERMRRAINKGV